MRSNDIQGEGAFDGSVRRQVNQFLQTASEVAPASPTAAGVKGQIAFDGTHIFLCVATNSWVRNTVAFSTFV